MHNKNEINFYDDDEEFREYLNYQYRPIYCIIYKGCSVKVILGTLKVLSISLIVADSSYANTKHIVTPLLKLHTGLEIHIKFIIL